MAPASVAITGSTTALLIGPKIFPAGRIAPVFAWFKNSSSLLRAKSASCQAIMKRLIQVAFSIGCAAVASLASVKAATVQVQVGADGLKFTPQDVTIQVGDTVQWVWAEDFHSATSGTPGNPDGLFDSGILSKGATFSFTFTTPGTVAYYCLPHGACCGMVGSVTVNAAIDTVTVTKAVYDSALTQLTVTATDTSDTATLTVTVTRTGETLGTLRNKGGGTYTAKFSNVLTNPQKITVTSNLGGTATARVKAR